MYVYSKYTAKARAVNIINYIMFSRRHIGIFIYL